MLTFFSRWWLTRKLNNYIKYKGPVFDISSGRNKYSFGNLKMNMSTRDERIRNGVEEDLFIEWYRGTESAAAIKEVIKDCVTLFWVEKDGSRLNVGAKGREVYMWYYPLIAAMSFLDRNTTFQKLLSWIMGATLISLAGTNLYRVFHP